MTDQTADDRRSCFFVGFVTRAPSPFEIDAHVYSAHTESSGSEERMEGPVETREQSDLDYKVEVGDFVIGCQPPRSPAFLFDAALLPFEQPVQVVPWSSFAESRGEASALDYLKLHPEGTLAFLPRDSRGFWLMGKKSRPERFLILDVASRSLLKEFESLGDGVVKYQGVSRYDGEAPDPARGAQEAPGGGFGRLARAFGKSFFNTQIVTARFGENEFGLFVPKHNPFGFGYAKHPVLADERWVGLEFPPALPPASAGSGSPVAPAPAAPAPAPSGAAERLPEGGSAEAAGIPAASVSAAAEAVEESVPAPAPAAPEGPVQDPPREVPPPRAAIPSASARDAERTPTSEAGFLRQFIAAVGACGFEYRPRDLVRFHASVKMGHFTVLGGAPGNGKSSLAKLYAMALAGNGGSIEDGFLAIDVNPSWVEPDDVTGYWGLNGGYVPASTGLVPFLRRSLSSDKVRLVCFEEMNLARVEHYLAHFMQALSREPGERRLPGIPEKEDSTDKNGHLDLVPSLRFVGTNNFDETTQNFSARFYDRCNYIELQRVATEPFSKGLPKIDGSRFSFGVSWAEYQSWIRADPSPESLDGSAKETYRKALPFLEALGIAPSRRVENDILAYIANRPFFAGCGDGGNEDGPGRQKAALDEAIAQRVLPRYRFNYLRPGEAERCAKLLDCLKNEGLALSAAFFREAGGKDERPGR